MKKLRKGIALTLALLLVVGWNSSFLTMASYANDSASRAVTDEMVTDGVENPGESQDAANDELSPGNKAKDVVPIADIAVQSVSENAADSVSAEGSKPEADSDETAKSEAGANQSKETEPNAAATSQSDGKSEAKTTSKEAAPAPNISTKAADGEEADEEWVTITFDMNGHGEQLDPIRMKKGDRIESLPTPQPKEGEKWVFSNWKRDYGGNWYLDYDPIGQEVMKDLELICNWWPWPTSAVHAIIGSDDQPLDGLDIYVSVDDGPKEALTGSGGWYNKQVAIGSKVKMYYKDELLREYVHGSKYDSTYTLIFQSVDFYSNGQEFKNPEAYKRQVYREDTILDKPADPEAVDSRYTFVRWTKKPESDSEVWEFPLELDFNSELYAQWAILGEDEVAYTVTGTGVKEDEDTKISISDGFRYTIKPDVDDNWDYPCTLNRVEVGGKALESSQYTFNEDTGEIVIDKSLVDGNVKINADMKKVPVRVFYHENNGVTDKVAHWDETNDSSTMPYINHFRLDNYQGPEGRKVFAGWNTKPDGSGIMIQPMHYIKMPQFYDTDECHMYAIWEVGVTGVEIKWTRHDNYLWQVINRGETFENVFFAEVKGPEGVSQEVIWELNNTVDPETYFDPDTGTLHVGENENSMIYLVAKSAVQPSVSDTRNIKVTSNIIVKHYGGETALFPTVIDGWRYLIASDYPCPPNMVLDRWVIAVGDNSYIGKVYNTDSVIVKDPYIEVHATYREPNVKFHGDETMSEVTKPVGGGDTVKKPDAPIKEGYTLVWYTDSARTVRYDFSTPVSQDLDLYPKWVPNYDISYGMNQTLYEHNGDSSNPEQKELEYDLPENYSGAGPDEGDSLTITLPDLPEGRAPFSFTGWNVYYRNPGDNDWNFCGNFAAGDEAKIPSEGTPLEIDIRAQSKFSSQLTVINTLEGIEDESLIPDDYSLTVPLVDLPNKGDATRTLTKSDASLSKNGDGDIVMKWAISTDGYLAPNHAEMVGAWEDVLAHINNLMMIGRKYGSVTIENNNNMTGHTLVSKAEDELSITHSGYVLGTTHVYNQTLNVKSSYTANPHTTTFDPNGGTWADGTTEPIVLNGSYGDTIIVMDAPAREGYEFDYWEGSKYNPGDEYVIREDHTLIARWKKKPDSGEVDNGGSNNSESGGGSSDNESGDTTVGNSDGESDNAGTGIGSPATGDDSTLMLWIALIMFATGGLYVLHRLSDPKRHNE